MYALPIWSPHYGVDIDRLERTQHIFLRFLSFKCVHPMWPFSHDYSFVMNLFKVPSLKSLRESRDILYSFKLLYKLIDWGDLTDLFITRNISYDLQRPRMLEEKTYSIVRTLSMVSLAFKDNGWKLCSLMGNFALITNMFVANAQKW